MKSMMSVKMQSTMIRAWSTAPSCVMPVPCEGMRPVATHGLAVSGSEFALEHCGGVGIL